MAAVCTFRSLHILIGLKFQHSALSSDTDTSDTRRLITKYATVSSSQQFIPLHIHPNPKM